MNSPQGIGIIALAGLCLVLTAACAPAGQPEPAQSAPSEPAFVRLDRSVLEDPTRPEQERAQDEYRKAIDVYEFVGVQPGMTVADVWPGAGYNTHLLSRLVGDTGRVYAVMEFYAAGRYSTLEALQERIEQAQLDNVEIFEKIGDVPADSVDVAIAVRNYHDAGQLGDGRPETVRQLYQMVKPGGVVGIVEVATPRPGWDEETHRLNEQTVIEEFTAGGFELVGRSDILANPEDDHTTTGFPDRYKMDRYLLKFRKPAADGAG